MFSTLTEVSADGDIPTKGEQYACYMAEYLICYSIIIWTKYMY